MMPILAPLFQGDSKAEWKAYGEAVTCPPHAGKPSPGASMHRLNELLTHPTLLRELLCRHALHLGVRDGDLRATASAWSLDYLWMLLPVNVAAAGLLRHGLPNDPARVTLEIDPRGAPIRLHLPNEGSSLAAVGEKDPVEGHLEELLMRHLLPLFDALSMQSRLPSKILWANARRVLTAIFDALAPDHTDTVAATAEQDMPYIARLRQALLIRARWSGQLPNPLGAEPAIRQARDGRHEPPLYAQCCLRHLLPGQSHCGPCPLSPATVGIQERKTGIA